MGIGIESNAVTPVNVLVDSHCHIDFPDFEKDLSDVLKRAAQSGVAYLLCVSVDVRKLERIKELTRENDHIFASVGIHPNLEQQGEAELKVADLVEKCRDSTVVAVGETGLDYYRNDTDSDWQRQRFRTHIQAAKSTNLPLIVHTRNAREDTIGILKEEGAGECGGVMHCFTEDWEMARQALDLGFYISFSGIVTFKSAAELQGVARRVPLDRLLVETDAPYLAPMPMRGKRNEPAFVRYTAEFLSDIRGELPDEFARETTGNFFRLFSKAVK